MIKNGKSVIILCNIIVILVFLVLIYFIIISLKKTYNNRINKDDDINNTRYLFNGLLLLICVLFLFGSLKNLNNKIKM